MPHCALEGWKVLFARRNRIDEMGRDVMGWDGMGWDGVHINKWVIFLASSGACENDALFSLILCAYGFQ